MTSIPMKIESSSGRRVQRFRCPCVTFLVATVLMLPHPAAIAAAQQAGATWSLSDQPLLSVGRVDGPQEELFNSITGALRLSDGRYVIADGGELRLAIYSADGRFQNAFGRNGRGPGEFRAIQGLWLAGVDTIAVWDGRLQRITRFLPDGTVIRTDALSYASGSPPGTPDPFYGATSDGRIILAWISPSRRVPDQLLPDTMTFGLYERDGRFVRVLGSQIGMQRMIAPGVGGGPVAFSSWPWTAIVRDTLVFTNGIDGAIHFFDPRSDAQRAARTLRVPGRPPSLAAAWNALDAELSDGAGQPFMIRLARLNNRSIGQVPHFARMFADDRGRVWLKEYDPSRDAVPVRKGYSGTGGRWRIVETDGRPVATITLPDGITPIAARGNDLLAVARDELDVESFVVYRINR